ncbi:MAG: hypothetical protein RIS36_1218 [Pseudomonadota bacterium]|jgi:hypothetical protein
MAHLTKITFVSSWNGVGANEHRGNVNPCFGSYIAPFPRARARKRERERTRTSNFISSLLEKAGNSWISSSAHLSR